MVLKKIKMTNPQEQFWSGEDGNDYIARNAVTVDQVESMRWLFGKILPSTRLNRMQLKAVIELGINAGVNMVALHQHLEAWRLPDPVMHGVEINQIAAERARTVADNVANCSALDLAEIKAQLGAPWNYDLVMTKGLLIHIAPKDLPKAYEVINSLARRHILIMEYYAPKMEMIEYRGESDRLWRAPHAEQLMEAYPDLGLLDYGFVSKLDDHPQDDITWWLLERRNAFADPNS